MSGQIRYRCNACGETFDLSSVPEESSIECPACQSHDLHHVPGNKPLDNLRDRMGDSILLKLGKAVFLVVAIYLSLIALLWAICFAS